MQLEQLGSDVLAMMDTPDKERGENQLVGFIKNDQGDDLRDRFLDNCKMRAGDADADLRAQAYLSYRRSGDSVNTTRISSLDESFTGRENTVRVTRWVQLTEKPNHMPTDMRSGPQAVLVEVLLWRA